MDSICIFVSEFVSLRYVQYVLINQSLAITIGFKENHYWIVVISCDKISLEKIYTRELWSVLTTEL